MDCILCCVFVLFIFHTVRLVNGSSPRSGRVEAYVDGAWGTICDHDWNIADARAICVELGLPRATSAPGGAQFGQGDGEILCDKVLCDLLDSPPSTLECDGEARDVLGCDHSNDAGVVCGLEIFGGK